MAKLCQIIEKGSHWGRLLGCILKMRRMIRVYGDSLRELFSFFRARGEEEGFIEGLIERYKDMGMVVGGRRKGVGVVG